jgi:NAD(P)-dependent dehydrogenase (short-subunit alcohol dehydrogenase family)
MELFSLAGRVAVVTGAAGTLGRHFGRVLHQAGACVALAARRPAAVTADAAALGERAMAVALDVTDAAAIAAALDAVEARFGTCDLLVNNAGIANTRPLLDVTEADWDAVMGVDLRGAFVTAQAAARRMVAAGKGGAIVNIASIGGARVIQGVAAYTAAKAGLLHLTRQMGVELARHRIRVNAIAPGYIETDINRDLFASEAGQAMLKRIPQRRLGTPADLTGPLLLLASDAGAHMTGSVVTVDGGHSVNSL